MAPSKLISLFFAFAFVAATLQPSEARVPGFKPADANQEASEPAIVGNLEVPEPSSKAAAADGSVVQPSTWPGFPGFSPLPGLPFMPLLPGFFGFPPLPSLGLPFIPLLPGFPPLPSLPLPPSPPLPSSPGGPPSKPLSASPGLPGAPPSPPLPGFPGLFPPLPGFPGLFPPLPGFPGLFPPLPGLPLPGAPPHPGFPGLPGSAPSPPQPKECLTPLMGMMPCMDYLTNTSVLTPPSTCCDGYKSLISNAPICLCHGMNGDMNTLLPKPVLPLRMMFLPVTCGTMPPIQTLFMCSTQAVPPLMPPSSPASPPVSPSSGVSP